MSPENFPIFSICHATGRPEGWKDSYLAWLDSAKAPGEVEYVLCVDERMGFEKAPEGGFRVVWDTGKVPSAVGAWNTAAKASSGRILILNSDDMRPEKGWDKKLAEGLDLEEDFVIEVRSGTRADEWRLMVLPILSRKRFERLGYALFPEYLSMFADNEFTMHAWKDGVVRDRRDLVFPHLHPEKDLDSVYVWTNRTEAFRVGEEVFRRRSLEGFRGRGKAATLS
jgi:hypothetical protein